MINVDKGNFSADGTYGEIFSDLKTAIISVFDIAIEDSKHFAASATCTYIATAADDIKEKHGVDILEKLKEEYS